MSYCYYRQYFLHLIWDCVTHWNVLCWCDFVSINMRLVTHSYKLKTFGAVIPLYLTPLSHIDTVKLDRMIFILILPTIFLHIEFFLSYQIVTCCISQKICYSRTYSTGLLEIHWKVGIYLINTFPIYMCITVKLSGTTNMGLQQKI